MNKVTIRKGKAPVPAQYARLHPDHRIIHHLTQTDAYKYSQGQFLLHRWSNERTVWEFHLRTKAVDLSYLYDYTVEQIHHLCTLRYTE